MTPNRFQQLQLNFSGMGCWLTTVLLLGLITTVGIGWLLKSLLVLVALLVLVPVVLIVGAQFWLKRNFVEGACPACAQPLTGFKTMPMVCPSCGVELQVADGQFARATQEGTIDVDVINVDASSSVDDTTEATVVDVQVLPPADAP